MKDVLRILKNDRNWNYDSKLSKIILWTIIIVGFVLVLISLCDVEYYKYLINEDGIIEYASALFWFMGALVCICYLIYFPQKSRVAITAYTLLLLFYVVCCGEEISWGQRIFHFQGPESIIKINKQQELNIHDIGHISIFSNLFFLLFLAFFYFYPYLYAKKEKFNDFVKRNQLPFVSVQAIKVASATLIIWFLIGIRFGTLGFHPFSIWGYYNQMDDEIFECLAAFSYLSFSVIDFQIKKRLTNRST